MRDWWPEALRLRALGTPAKVIARTLNQNVNSVWYCIYRDKRLKHAKGYRERHPDRVRERNRNYMRRKHKGGIGDTTTT